LARDVVRPLTDIEVWQRLMTSLRMMPFLDLLPFVGQAADADIRSITYTAEYMTILDASCPGASAVTQSDI
jgi:hypothetical protein